jgi:hypothetical protein
MTIVRRFTYYRKLQLVEGNHCNFSCIKILVHECNKFLTKYVRITKKWHMGNDSYLEEICQNTRQGWC